MAASIKTLRNKWSSWLRRITGRAVHKPGALREDEDLSAWCREAADALHLPELARRLRVRWNPRLQTTAGRAIWPDGLIELNPKLPEVGGDVMLRRILRHELAHLVAYARSRRRRIAPHGPEWQQACVELGIPGEPPYHDLPFAVRKPRRRHVYACRHCGEAIRRVRPIRGSVACLKCCERHNQGLYHERFRMVRQAQKA